LGRKIRRSKDLLNSGYDINGHYGDLGFYPIYSAINSENAIEATFHLERIVFEYD
jgi:hypothetical protein